MAETYKKIFPGNWVAHLNAHALPNASFKANKRAVGDPRDRHQQGVLFMPGWIAPVNSTAKGGAHAMPSNLPFRRASANSRTRPSGWPRATARRASSMAVKILYCLSVMSPRTCVRVMSVQ